MFQLIYDMETGNLTSQVRWNSVDVANPAKQRNIYKDTVVVVPDYTGSGAAKGELGLYFDRLYISSPINTMYSSYPYTIHDPILPYFSPFNSRANEQEVIVAATQYQSDIDGLKAELANIFIVYNKQLNTLKIVNRSNLEEADVNYINDHFGTLPWFKCPGNGTVFSVSLYFNYSTSMYTGKCINIRWSSSTGWIICGQNTPDDGEIALTAPSSDYLEYSVSGEIVRNAISDTTGLENSIRTLQVQTEELYQDMVRLSEQLTSASKFFITR